MSWKSEVIADSSGKWCANALRFTTKRETESYGQDLAMRWTLVRDHRAKRCKDAVTHVWTNGRLELNQPQS